MAKVIFEFTEEEFSVRPLDDGDEISGKVGVSVSIEGAIRERLNLPSMYASVLMQNAGAVIDALHKTVNQRMERSGYSIGPNAIIKHETH